MPRYSITLVLSLLAAAILVLPLSRGYAQDEAVSFSRDVRPILAARCFACHGPEENEGGLALHDHAAALAEMDSGARAIVAGEPGESALLARIASDDADTRMPPDEEPLSPDDIAKLRSWIEAGAKWEAHWAFVPPTRRKPPAFDDTTWVRNPIDAFILAKLIANGLEPVPPADSRTLARRVYYNVTGLPPTEKQLAEYLADERPDAYERLIDRLLASPQYGEKWARHWL
ncbi:MAG: DUF1549 domain-containing protein, partial [Aeoliella sp.]